MAMISHPTPDDSNFRDGIQKDSFSLTAGQVAWYHNMALTRGSLLLSDTIMAGKHGERCWRLSLSCAHNR